MLTAKDIMTTEVFSVTPEMDVDELAKKFVTLKKNAMPVLDHRQCLIGIVTQTDLVEQDKPLHIPTVISLFDWVFYLESEKTSLSGSAVSSPADASPLQSFTE